MADYHICAFNDGVCKHSRMPMMAGRFGLLCCLKCMALEATIEAQQAPICPICAGEWTIDPRTGERYCAACEDRIRKEHTSRKRRSAARAMPEKKPGHVVLEFDWKNAK